ncbi:SaV-like [uncultured Caudovirales phage]|uniref:SaV-like n=1 Tax=uncultured Caudovirales phage TaxID=2100421 RepID=A0A6J5LFC5_9CAUD|nr:SaV-like [uncultured Caudovirales phage]CAB4132881.1 SaV-like [uncultured Caudovirales phage]
MSANDIQHGGTHYKQFTHETWDVINDWGLGYFDGNAVKYLSRWRHKGGVEDLKKARHYIDKLIELETRDA